MDRDPFELLGIAPTSTADDVHRARRRLAKRAHPDHGGDAARMQAINAAADAALLALNGSPAVAPDDPPFDDPPFDDPPFDDPRTDDPETDEVAQGPSPRVANDSPCFTVEALPLEAFEALVIVANWMGEVLVGDPPYVLESQLGDPFDCWCRLDIAPDAGASSVSVTVATFDDRTLPDLDVVRDAWVANLNQLDWDQLHGHRLGDDRRFGDDRRGPNRSPPS
jgi:hypothetical protein